MKSRIVKILLVIVIAFPLFFVGNAVIQAAVGVLNFSGEEDLDKIEDNIDLLAGKVLALDEAKGSLKGEVDDLINKLEGKNLTIEEKRKTINHLEDSVKDLEKQLENYYSPEDLNGLIAGYIEEVGRYKEIADDRQMEINSLKGKNEELIASIESKEEEIERIINDENKAEQKAMDYKDLYLQQREETKNANKTIEELKVYSDEVVEDVSRSID